MTAAKSAAVLISGGGSNLQALLDAAQHADCHYEISAVVSNVPDAGGLERAKKAGVPVHCVPHKGYVRREEYDAELADTLTGYSPDFVFLAGFMRILTPAFINRFVGRILNIHPSLLPKFPGLNTHQRVIDAGESHHGCTVHFVSAELDAGPAIMQGMTPVSADDTAETLAARVLNIEHTIYPRAASLLASGRLEQRGKSAWLDGRKLSQAILQ